MEANKVLFVFARLMLCFHSHFIFTASNNKCLVPTDADRRVVAMAASEGAPGLITDDVWHLVNYLLSIAEVPPPVPVVEDK